MLKSWSVQFFFAHLLRNVLSMKRKRKDLLSKSENKRNENCYSQFGSFVVWACNFTTSQEGAKVEIYFAKQADPSDY